MNMNIMPTRKRQVEEEVLDPVLTAGRNRDVLRMTVGLVVLMIIVAVAMFTISQPSPLPPIMP
jgi:hypothetical protein